MDGEDLSNAVFATEYDYMFNRAKEGVQRLW